MTRYNFSPDEIEEALNILKQADQAHRAWHHSLLEGLLCDQPFSKSITDPVSHTKCGFGCWYYTSVSDAIRVAPEFTALEKTHKEMHDKARTIVERFLKTGKVKLDDYRFLSGKKDELTLLLSNLRDSIINQQHSFDALTGLINRKSIGLILEKNHAQAIRHNAPYTLAMIDIDYFKSINDTYGHLAGDEALKVLSHYFSTSLRDSDSVGRYGGEEFLILLPMTPLDISAKILERIREQVSQLVTRYEGVDIQLTISIGFSSFEMGKAVWEVVKEADQALYQAKKSGRNRIEVYKDTLAVRHDSLAEAG